MINKQSETWRAVVAKITESQASITDTLLKETTDTTRTTQLRARYWALQDVLSWADAAPEPTVREITF